MKLTEQQLLFHLTSKLANFSKEDLEWEIAHGKVTKFRREGKSISWFEMTFRNTYLDKHGYANTIVITDDAQGYTVRFEL